MIFITAFLLFFTTIHFFMESYDQNRFTLVNSAYSKRKDSPYSDFYIIKFDGDEFYAKKKNWGNVNPDDEFINNTWFLLMDVIQNPESDKNEAIALYRKV